MNFLNFREWFSLEALRISAFVYILSYLLALYIGQYGQWTEKAYFMFAVVGVSLGMTFDEFVPNEYRIGRIIAGIALVYSGYCILDKVLHT
jgi:hypothetical protein